MRCFRGMLRFRRLLLLRCAFFFFLLLLLYSLPVNPRDVGLIFRDCARKIHTKAVTADPNILWISVACGKVRLSSFLPSSLPTFPPCLPSFPPFFLPLPFLPLFSRLLTHPSFADRTMVRTQLPLRHPPQLPTRRRKSNARPTQPTYPHHIARKGVRCTASKEEAC